MIRTYDNMTDLWHQTMWSMWRGQLGGDLDAVTGLDTIAYDNLLSAESMAFRFDLGRDLWLNRQRWTRLVRQYLDQEELSRFLARAEDLGNGRGTRGAVTSMFCANVAREAKKHKWGNCMLAFTFRGGRNVQPVLTMHSRVSYIAYIGAADLALAHTLARYIAQRISLPVEKFGFRWHVDALQFHCFKSLPALFAHDYLNDLRIRKYRARYPTINVVGKWWDKILQFEEEHKTLADEKYGPLRRVRRRYQEYQDGLLMPSVPLKTLDFKALYR